MLLLLIMFKISDREAKSEKELNLISYGILFIQKQETKGRVCLGFICLFSVRRNKDRVLALLLV